MGQSRRNPATSGATTAQTSSSTSSAAISTITSSSSTSSSSSSTSKAEAKKITDLYQGQLEYKKALVDGATGDDKIRFQKQLDELNVKILTLTQAATSDPEEKTAIQAKIDVINSKDGSTSAKATTTKASAANTATTAQSTATVAKTTTATPSTATPSSNTPNVSAFGPEALKEVKSFLRQVEYFGTMRDSATTQAGRDLNQIKIDDANVGILKVELKYANNPVAKAAAQVKIDKITADSVKPFLGEVAYYQKAQANATTQEAKDIIQMKIDDTNLKILNVELKYASTQDVKVEVQSKIDSLTKNRKIVVAKPVDTASLAATPANLSKEEKAKAAEIATINKRLDALPEEFNKFFTKVSALVIPTLNNPTNPTKADTDKYVAALKVYNTQYQTLVDGNKALQAEELTLRAKLTTLSGTTETPKSSTFTKEGVAKEITKIQGRLGQIDAIYPTLLPNAMTLTAPVLNNITSPTAEDMKTFIADSKKYNETIKTLTDSSKALKAEKIELLARFDQLSKYKELTEASGS